MVINHSITHLSEFRQARGEGVAAGWEEGGEKAKEGMWQRGEELNDKRRNVEEKRCRFEDVNG